MVEVAGHSPHEALGLLLFAVVVLAVAAAGVTVHARRGGRSWRDWWDDLR